MATLADELLNDFEDSGDEQEEENGYQPGDDNGDPTNGYEGLTQPAGQDNGDDDDMEDAEEELEARQANGAVEDEDDAKTKVEKMQLGGVSDVRNVAGLMKTLQPVLEVSDTR